MKINEIDNKEGEKKDNNEAGGNHSSLQIVQAVIANQ